VSAATKIVKRRESIATMTKTEAHITASKFYLCEPLPEDFDELDEQDVTDFIRDNKWEPFEEWEPHGIYWLIEDLASEFLNITNTEK
jgi:hypothetical protein